MIEDHLGNEGVGGDKSGGSGRCREHPYLGGRGADDRLKHAPSRLKQPMTGSLGVLLLLRGFLGLDLRVEIGEGSSEKLG